MGLPLIPNTFMLLTLTTLSTPLLLPLLSDSLKNTLSTITNTVKTSFLISLIPMTIYIHSGTIPWSPRMWIP